MPSFLILERSVLGFRLPFEMLYRGLNDRNLAFRKELLLDPRIFRLGEISS